MIYKEEIVYSTYIACQSNDHRNCGYEQKVLSKILRCDCKCHQKEKIEVYRVILPDGDVDYQKSKLMLNGHYILAQWRIENEELILRFSEQCLHFTLGPIVPLNATHLNIKFPANSTFLILKTRFIINGVDLRISKFELQINAENSYCEVTIIKQDFFITEETL